MIKKIKEIKNLAIFKDFEWDTTVKEKDGSKKEFKDINIIYGRNYSGKTTISRIIRALETGKLSEKYENPDFKVSIKDETELTQNNLSSHSKIIRVFNEDFVRDNLRFIIDPEASIKSFAILGDGNNDLQKEIEAIKAILGENEEGKETGLYKELLLLKTKYIEEKKKHEAVKKKLNDQLSTKATGGKNSIKYNSSKFGNQNYNIRELEKDIATVQPKEFTSIDNTEKSIQEKLLEQNTLAEISELKEPELKIKHFAERAKELTQRKVSESGKIEELVKDAILNKWAKEGRKIHEEKRVNCGFCGNHITSERWSLLEKHFDEESDKLEQDITELIEEIETEKTGLKTLFYPSKNLFYSKFHQQIDDLITLYKGKSSAYSNELNTILKQLNTRKDDLINPLVFSEPKDYSEDVLSVWNSYEEIRQASNNFSSELADKKIEAQKLLRLREVSDFLDIIDYSRQITEIGKLKIEETTAKTNKETKENEIEEKEDEIKAKNRLLNDEEKGALKVNEYLNDFFGHGSLELRAIEENGDEEKSKQIRFQVIRDGNEAHHLSEGECSLLAFCYFMAKLEDVETKGRKPIIWIDDPISSLDGNHIFFIYSLIKSEIVEKALFEQLFVSTHNLDFLKYLKRLNKGYECAYFLINRKDKTSDILAMPKYLKEFITEFNFLFEQIYKCSEIDHVDDSNYTLFYNFGNNARKFLEIFLYYKYPDSGKDIEKMKKFFGDESIPSILTERVNNEYSHLSGAFERGSTPVEVPEMKKTAELIITKLKSDRDQYEALLKSIGVELVQEETV